MVLTQQHASKRQKTPQTSTSLAQRQRATPKRFHFTEKTIQALEAPTNGRSYHYDDEMRGWRGRHSDREKLSCSIALVAGRPERIPIGPCGELSVVRARLRAQEMNVAIAEGVNPAADRRAVRDEMTLEELFETYSPLYV